MYALRALPHAGTVLHLGAHPDDEDVGLMAWVARGLGQRIVYWSATRGEASQNRIGADRGARLGVYRSWESEQARRIDGGEVLYGPFVDYGFSKSGEEALQTWGRELLCREIVRAIRSVQPQVVVSRWSGSRRDGHGHHQAVGAVVREAFEAAADPTYAAELQDCGLPAWRASRLYCSMGGDWQPGQGGGMGQRVPEYEQRGLLRINAGARDPVTGESFQERGFRALNCHRSQGLGFVPEPGAFYYYYERLSPEPDATEQDLHTGLDPLLTGLVDSLGAGAEALRRPLAAVQAGAQAARDLFRVEAPGEAGEAVRDALAELRRLQAGIDEMLHSPPLRQAARRFLQRKAEEFNRVAGRCLGLRLDCLAERPRVARGQAVTISARAWSDCASLRDAIQLELAAPEGWQMSGAGPDAPPPPADKVHCLSVEVPRDAPLSCPYWLRRRGSHALYAWPDAPLSGAAFDPPLITARACFGEGDRRVELDCPAVFRQGFAGGYRQLPLSVVPSVAVQLQRSLEILPRPGQARRIPLEVAVERGPDQAVLCGRLRAELPEGWLAEPAEIAVELPRGIESRLCRFEIVVPAGTAPGAYFIGCHLSADGVDYDSGVQTVRMGAPGIPRAPDAENCIREAFITSNATLSVVVIDVAVAEGLRVGYIRGPDDRIPESLSHYDLDLQVLDERALRQDPLDYDAILLGPNAYLHGAAVAEQSGRLLEYAQAGGTLVVQHHGYAFEKGGFAPYPFGFSRPHDRVTQASAAVSLLEPDAPLLNYPNRIAASDFAGWVHDRGMYFFGSWDPRYQALLACADPGEEPRAGGLLLAAVGRGVFVYCAYSLFRQLPEGVEGAHRLIANLMSLPEARVRQRLEWLAKLSLFEQMSATCLRAIARISSERWLPQGSWLAHLGERGEELFVVLRGEVEVLADSRPDARRIALAGAGEKIGEFSVLADMPRTASLRARTDVHLLAIRREDFRALMRQEPDVSAHIIRALVAKVLAGGA